jgi:hypothetical protein
MDGILTLTANAQALLVLAVDVVSAMGADAEADVRGRHRAQEACLVAIE